MHRHILALPLCLAVFACGGLDRDAKISALAAEERQELCEQSIEAAGSFTEPKVCMSGTRTSTIDPPRVETCVQNLPENCTVGVYQDCFDSLAGDVCNYFSTTECQTLGTCASQDITED